MKRIYMVRHAKSDWGYEFLKDIDRPLNERGYGDAYTMSRRILDKQELPELIISSPATRALSTAMIFLRTFSYPTEKLYLDENLYEASKQDILDVIQGISSRLNTVMVFGHNPGFTEALELFTKSGIENLPTTGTAGIEFKVKVWKDVAAGTGKLVFFDYPKKNI